MTNIGKVVARGAFWMIGFRFIEKIIGILSTLILARLLTPNDFGIIAMVMAVYGLIEMGGQFGFDAYLIRNKDATDAHYNSAWTLSVFYGIFSAVMMLILAYPMSVFFSDNRVVNVMYCVSILALIQGFENIGIIKFRVEFRYDMDFILMFLKKISSFIPTVILAYFLRNYWALLIGMTIHRVASVYLSYRLHPYRPKIDFSELKNSMKFSKWFVLGGYMDFIINRGPEFYIGRILGSSPLGIFRVGKDISTFPTSELLYPIMRAVYPGYAALQSDKVLLSKYFLMVQGLIISLALPAGVGIVVLSTQIVNVLLGVKWLDAVPVVNILGLYGAISVFQGTNTSMFNLLNRPRWGFYIKTVEMFLLLVFVLIFGINDDKLLGVVYAMLAAHVLTIPFGMYLIGRVLPIKFSDRISVTWRPFVASLFMYGTVNLYLEYFNNEFEMVYINQVLFLLSSVALGVISYCIAIISAWWLSGKPEGAESRMLNYIFRNITFGRKI